MSIEEKNYDPKINFNKNNEGNGDTKSDEISNYDDEIKEYNLYS